MLDGPRQDLRHALRQLRRSPGFAAIAILTLALGIGASAAIFSVVDGVLLRPAPFPSADRLVVVWETDRNSGTTREPGSWPDLEDYQAQSRTFQELAGFVATQQTMTSRDRDPERVSVMLATHGLLPLLGVQPLAGRLFGKDEDTPGGARVALLGERFWKTRFGGDPDVMGRTFQLDGQSYSVIGVAPAGADLGVNQINARAAYHAPFEGRGHVDVWVPLQASADILPRSTHPVFFLGRLAPGATLTGARQELSGIASRLEAQYRENAGRGVHLESFGDVVFGPARPALRLLLAVVALVLLVACANVANLLLARGTGRSREVAVRSALGAGARRLARQFLAESLVLSLASAVLGVVLAIGGLRLLLALAPAGIPRLDQVAIDGRVLLVTSLLAALVAVAFSLVPTFQARRVDLTSALRSESGRGSSASAGRRWLRSALVVGEVALAVVVLVSASLLVESFQRLRHVDPGFDVSGTLKARYSLPASRYPQDYSKYPNWTEVTGFHRALLRRVAALPGVTSAAISGADPLDAGFTNSFLIVGREEEAAHQPEIRTRQISPDYLSTARIPIVAGRGIRPSDDVSAAPVALVNQAAVRRYFPSASPIGEQIRFWGASRRIVGVVGDVKFQGLDQATPPAVYVPIAQTPMAGAGLLVRTSVDPATLEAPIRRIVHDLDPDLALYGMEPMSQALAGTLAGPRFIAALIGIFAALAVLLALVGVESILAYAVARRRPELGIRMALGAGARRVRAMVIGDGLRLAGLGLLLGLVAALAFSKLLAGLLFEVTPVSPPVYVGVAGLVVAATVLAAWIPARRATRVDPMAVLREE
jgi:putative ABC transport system permease protein